MFSFKAISLISSILFTNATSASNGSNATSASDYCGTHDSVNPKEAAGQIKNGI